MAEWGWGSGGQVVSGWGMGVGGALYLKNGAVEI